jgi:hydrogenase nickel incorporation protein HypB
MNIKVLRNVLEANDAVAARLRERFQAEDVTVINLISAPGAGKTSLLEQTIPLLAPRLRVAVLEGDIAGTQDAERIGKLNVPVVQLLTGGACHLEAPLVERGLGEIDLSKVDLLFIENVGNIACPAEFDLGETAKVGLLSYAEGHDKPAKYPLLFHEVKALVLNKADLAPYTDFDRAKFDADFRKLNGSAPVFELSCRTKQGLKEWAHWLEHVVEGEIAWASHTHDTGALGDVVQPHAHPHRTHHQGVAEG